MCTGKTMILLLLFSGLIFLCGFRRKRATIAPALPFQKTIMITGHRGAAGLAPENTLSAIRKGLELKCDRIEIDIHQTSDSVLVLMHDETIDRTTNGSGKIKNLPYSTLQEYTIKSSGKTDSIPEKIPTLEQAFQLIDGKAVLLIELKEGNEVYPGIEERVIAIIRKYQAEKWCIIHSFKESILDKVHAAAPEIELHRLLLTGIATGKVLDGYITEVSVFRGLLTKSFIDKVHKAGRKINAWTVNSRDDIEYLLSLGVDGIITDFPDLAREALQEWQE